MSAGGSDSPVWQWQNPLPQGNSLFGAACPDGRTCYAVGSGVIMVSHDGGRRWAITLDKADGGFTALSCPGRSACYAIANTGPNAAAIVGTNDGGATWTRLWQGERGPDHLACPGISVCYAVGTYTPAMLTTTNGGRSWTQTRLSFQPVNIACPTTNVCYAPLSAGLITSPPPSVAMTTDGGATWAVRPVGLPKGSAQLGTIACLSRTTCIVVASSLSSDYRTFSLRTRDSGLSWQRREFPLDVFDRGTVLSCPTTGICYVAGDNGSPNGGVVSTSDAGLTWTRRQSLPFTPTGIACGTARHCIVTGNGGALARTDTGWVTRRWVTRNAAVGSVPHLVPALHALACPSRRVCYAGGDFGAVVKTVNGGERWAPLDARRVIRLLGAPVSSLACPTPNLCFAGAYSTYPTRATVIETRDGGRSWSPKPGGGFAVVTCPSRSVCYAGGLRGVIERTRDGGRTWSRQRTPLAGRPYAIQHLVCPTTRVCYATAIGPSEPPPHPRSNVGALLETDNGGSTWRRTLTDPFPFALACRTSTDCFALLDGDRPGGMVPTLLTQDGGYHWQRQNVLPPGAWSAATCPRQNTCYLAGGGGTIAVSRDGLRNWRQEETPTFNALEAIRCPGPGMCYAAGQFSTILIGH